MKVLLLLIFGVTAVLTDESQLLKEFSEGNVRFSADVYKELLKTNTGSFLVCPFSAETILALAHAGAKGQTAQELSNGLHLPSTHEKVQETFQKLISRLKENSNYTLSTANKVYVKEGVSINDGFKSTAVNVFGAEIQNIDFSKKEQAASEMNKWVEEKTQQKIKNLISDDDITPDLYTVLVNAMYFKGTWKVAFDPKRTATLQFYVNEQKQVEVDMMSRISFYDFYENKDLDAKFVELPYEGNDVTMTIVLPNAKNGLSALESRISEVFAKPKYYTEHLIFEIPKFKIETNIKFTPILQNLGIVNPFRIGADFSGINDAVPLHISTVIQKTFIEIHEFGTEASAASGGFAVASSFPTNFRADHPFIYYIKHEDVVLFVGRYTGLEA